MSYLLLGQDLHHVADHAKKYFATEWGASKFRLEEAIVDIDKLPLRPTWQARMPKGYTLCVNVQSSPFSPTLDGFVNTCAQKGLPIKLWVAMPSGGLGEGKGSLSADMRRARELGVGVVEIEPDGAVHVCHRAVPLSLFALKKTDLSRAPKERREDIKNAEATFREGTPDQACQSICQQLEYITRQFAERTYSDGLWSSPKGASAYPGKFFAKDPWANVLEVMERRLDYSKVAAKSKTFGKQSLVRVRALTDWRNDLSHKPKTIKQLQERDSRLRTMFEVTMDSLIEWYSIVKPFHLV